MVVCRSLAQGASGVAALSTVTARNSASYWASDPSIPFRRFGRNRCYWRRGGRISTGICPQASGRSHRVSGFCGARHVVKERRRMAATRKLHAGATQLLNDVLFREVLFK